MTQLLARLSRLEQGQVQEPADNTPMGSLLRLIKGKSIAFSISLPVAPNVMPQPAADTVPAESSVDSGPES
jgi:hypothetical protein